MSAALSSRFLGLLRVATAFETSAWPPSSTLLGITDFLYGDDSPEDDPKQVRAWQHHGFNT
ncbi:hypothetical protein CVT26_012532 [Gymnopilus dilepis]|uniref:Uncharacterized protein n=1 Tax=Gymnopilus dilepis TaxID=231916 RepID=A0A409WAK7_9AGAR|nr:hypothetical protein CVT26_012532 [Gymnopilus dilepis]